MTEGASSALLPSSSPSFFLSFPVSSCFQSFALVSFPVLLLSAVFLFSFHLSSFHLSVFLSCLISLCPLSFSFPIFLSHHFSHVSFFSSFFLDSSCLLLLSPSQQMVWYPLSQFFFLAVIKHTLHLTTHMHEHFISVHLNVSPSAYLFFPPLSVFTCLSLSSNREEGSCSLSDKGMQTGWIWWVSHLYLFCFQNHCLVGIHQDFSIKKSRVRNYCKNNLQFKCSFVIIHP